MSSKAKHPTQPLINVGDRERFRSNKIVKDLIDILDREAAVARDAVRLTLTYGSDDR